MNDGLPPMHGDVESAALRTWRRRHLRRIALFVCTPGLLLGALTAGAADALGVFDHPTHACGMVTAAAVVRDSFGVRVLNGSGHSGLARHAAAALRSAGFRITFVGNAAERDWNDETAVIRYGPHGSAQAQLVASALGGSRLVEDLRTGSGVDVILGTTYRSGAEPGAQAATIATAKPASGDGSDERCTS